MCPSLSPAPFLCPRVPPALCARAFSSPQTRGPRAPKPLCAPRASRRRRPPFYCFWATHTHSAGRRRRALALPSPQQKKDRPVREPPGPRQQPSLARRRAPARRAYHQAISSSWFATLLLPPPPLFSAHLSLSLCSRQKARGPRAPRRADPLLPWRGRRISLPPPNAPSPSLRGPHPPRCAAGSPREGRLSRHPSPFPPARRRAAAQLPPPSSHWLAAAPRGAARPPALLPGRLSTAARPLCPRPPCAPKPPHCLCRSGPPPFPFCPRGLAAGGSF